MISNKDYTDLSEYANLDGTEIGTYVNNIIELRQFTCDHGMSVSFSEELDKELAYWLTTFREETIIEEKIEPQPDITYKELVWL